LPFILSLFLVIYLSVDGSSKGIDEFIHEACQLGVEAEYKHRQSVVRAKQDACEQSYMYNVQHEVFWAILRCGLQVPSQTPSSEINGGTGCIRSHIAVMDETTGYGDYEDETAEVCFTSCEIEIAESDIDSECAIVEAS
jgi:hypothetical protein